MLFVKGLYKKLDYFQPDFLTNGSIQNSHSGNVRNHKKSSLWLSKREIQTKLFNTFIYIVCPDSDFCTALLIVLVKRRS